MLVQFLMVYCHGDENGCTEWEGYPSNLGQTTKGCQEAPAFASYWIRCRRCTSISRYFVKFLLLKGKIIHKEL